MACQLTTKAGAEQAIQEVNVTVLQNTKALKQGDELLLYVEPTVPTTSRPAETLAVVTRKRPAAAMGPTAARTQKKQKQQKKAVKRRT